MKLPKRHVEKVLFYPWIRYSKEVEQAGLEDKPIVALESTIISHGMPYPMNRDTALALEAIVRSEGAVPATIGMIDGQIVVGLSREEIESFSTRKDIKKVSRRDLPIVMARKEWGAMTVSGTIIAMSMAGIRVFATGGIGGVHRGAEETWDVSRDLYELGSHNVLVVCAGAKAILDLPKTLEVLESQGVSVLSYRSPTFASFYSRSSGLPVDLEFDDPEIAARVLMARIELGLTGGVLVSNPCPVEMAMDPKEAETAIQTAVADAKQRKIHGKSLTPYLLSEITKLTGGSSLETNIALVENNARLAAKIAVCYAKAVRPE